MDSTATPSWISLGTAFLLAILGFKARWIQLVSTKVDKNRDDLFEKLGAKVDKQEYIDEKNRLQDSIIGLHKKIDDSRNSTERKIENFNQTILDLVKCSKNNNF